MYDYMISWLSSGLSCRLVGCIAVAGHVTALIRKPISPVKRYRSGRIHLLLQQLTHSSPWFFDSTGSARAIYNGEYSLTQFESSDLWVNRHLMIIPHPHPQQEASQEGNCYLSQPGLLEDGMRSCSCWAICHCVGLYGHIVCFSSPTWLPIIDFYWLIALTSPLLL